MVTLTTEQQSKMDDILCWYVVADGPLTLGGYAGTGKTTLLGHLQQSLDAASGFGRKPRVVFASYTGKAVSVLRKKLPPGSEAMTLHRLLYRPRQIEVCAYTSEPVERKYDSNGQLVTLCETHCDETESCEVKKKVDFTPSAFPLEGIDLVVVDEASMVTEKIWADLTSHGVPILAVGDHGQLPPIRSDFDLMRKPDIRLEKILRQAADNPIIKMATMA